MGEVSQRACKAVVSALGELWRVMSVVALSAQLSLLVFRALVFRALVFRALVFRGLALGALTLVVKQAHAQPTSPTPTSLEALTQEALSARLELKRNERLIEAEGEAITAVWGWANPSVGYTLAPAPLETKRGETPQSLTLKQRLPQLNVTTHQRAQLALRREAREVTQRALERGVARGLLEALWGLWSVERAEGRSLRRLEWLSAQQESQRGLIESSTGALSELQALEVERALTRARLASLKQRAQGARARLGDELGRDAPYLEPLPVEFTRSSGSWLTLIKAHHAHTLSALAGGLANPQAQPQLQQLQLSLSAAQEGLALLEAQQGPQLEVGVQWVNVRDTTGVSPQGDDAFIAQLGVSLPVWREADQGERRALTARLRAQQLEVRRAEQSWRSATRVMSAELSALAASLERYELEVVPQSEGLIELLTAEVSAGQRPLSALFQRLTQHEALLTQRDELIAGYGREAARLAELTGGAAHLLSASSSLEQTTEREPTAGETPHQQEPSSHE